MLFSMKTLLIETSQSTGAIALASEGKILSSHTFGQSPGALKILLPSIQTLLREHNWELKELCRIAVGIGPGSYTGMRVGITVAQTLAFALKLPFTSFCSLFAFIPPKQKAPLPIYAPPKKGTTLSLKALRRRMRSLTHFAARARSCLCTDPAPRRCRVYRPQRDCPLPLTRTSTLCTLLAQSPTKAVKALYFP